MLKDVEKCDSLAGLQVETELSLLSDGFSFEGAGI